LMFNTIIFIIYRTYFDNEVIKYRVLPESQFILTTNE